MEQVGNESVETENFKRELKGIQIFIFEFCSFTYERISLCGLEGVCNDDL